MLRRVHTYRLLLAILLLLVVRHFFKSRCLWLSSLFVTTLIVAWCKVQIRELTAPFFSSSTRAAISCTRESIVTDTSLPLVGCLNPSVRLNLPR